MKREFGLLACGSSRCWNVDVDQSLADEEVFFLVLHGPKTYLNLQLRDLSVIRALLHFLQACSKGERPEPLELGHFGSDIVEVIDDSEGSPRCSLAIRDQTSATLSLTLAAEDIDMLVVALRQVMEDLASST